MQFRAYYLLFAFVACPFFVFAQHGNAAYNAYIENYHEIAIKQQKEHGIPASITLAQGILESGAGKGTLAVKANNHFGIKCHDWTGAKIYHDDDKKNECFRKYKRVIDSYEDHSTFLTTRSRYASLFELEPTDYKSWAHELKKTGYATDPAYAYKLISLIEEYELHRFDLMTTKETAGKSSKIKIRRQKRQKTTQQKIIDADSKKTTNDLSSTGTIYAYSIHELQKMNGLEYVVARGGDTFGSIADEFGLKEKHLLAYNEMPENTKPEAGTRVYLQKKKRKAPKGFDTHIIQEGESLYSIAQFYGIRLVNLFDMNNMSYDQKAEVGKILKVRP